MTDDAAIRQTLALWAQRFDDHDAAGWAELFAADAKFVTPRAEFVGRQAIRNYVDAHVAREEPIGRRMKHFCANAAIHFTSETSAEANTDFIVFTRTGESPWEILTVGRYVNRLVREDGTWRFVENIVTHS